MSQKNSSKDPTEVKVKKIKSLSKSMNQIETINK